MELAAILALVLLDYLDFVLIVALLFTNAALGFYEERTARKAISALEQSLSPSCIVRKKSFLAVVLTLFSVCEMGSWMKSLMQLNLYQVKFSGF
jgi:magnesium-transporting ATPase (P-type)